MLYGLENAGYDGWVQVRSRIGIAVALGVAAATSGTRAWAQLMTDYVPPSLLQSKSAAAVTPQSSLARADANVCLVTPKRNPSTSGERWEEFETEFGVTKKSPSMMKGSLESAKYQLDKTTFAMQEFVDNVTDAVSFDYGWQNRPGPKPGSTSAPRQPSSNRVLYSLENARLKSDIDLKIAGRSFVGVKLVLPIGD